jgi:hypothetical protein
MAKLFNIIISSLAKWSIVFVKNASLSHYTIRLAIRGIILPTLLMTTIIILSSPSKLYAINSFYSPNSPVAGMSLNL